MDKYKECIEHLLIIVGAVGIYKTKHLSTVDVIKIFEELIDKATPKKLNRYPFSKEWHCPTCGSGNGEYEETVGTHNYCHYCGQKLEWED